MNKHILLGLLLVPCVSHAMNTMSEIPVTKHSLDGDTAYKRDIFMAYQEGATYKASMFRSDKQCWTSIAKGNEAAVVFNELKNTYEQQQAKADNK